MKRNPLNIIPFSFGVFVLLFAFAFYIFAWTEPTAVAPGNNVATPLNISNVGQSKAGGLSLNTGGAPIGLIVQNGSVGIGTITPGYKLDVAGNINATQLCIGGSCQSSWPAATAATACFTVSGTNCGTASAILYRRTATTPVPTAGCYSGNSNPCVSTWSFSAGASGCYQSGPDCSGSYPYELYNVTFATMCCPNP